MKNLHIPKKQDQHSHRSQNIKSKTTLPQHNTSKTTTSQNGKCKTTLPQHNTSKITTEIPTTKRRRPHSPSTATLHPEQSTPTSQRNAKCRRVATPSATQNTATPNTATPTHNELSAQHPDLPPSWFKILDNRTYECPIYRDLHAQDHLDWCWQLDSPGNQTVLPDHVSEAMEKSAANPLDALDNAESALEHWLTRKQQLAKQWEDERNTLAPHVRDILGTQKSIPLLREIMKAADSPDNTFCDDLAQGFPLTGTANISGEGELLPHADPEISRDKLFSDAKKYRNAEAIERTTNSKADGEVYDLMLAKTLTDQESGICKELELTQHLCDTSSFCCRFPRDEGMKRKVNELTGEKYEVRKVRCCDYYKCAHLNRAFRATEKFAWQHIDHVAALGRGMRAAAETLAQNTSKSNNNNATDELTSDMSLELAADDFSGAYNSLPIDSRDLPAAIVMLFDAQANKPRVFQTLACPFGSVGSVVSWGRTSRMCQRILSVVFGLPISVYVDDIMSVWPKQLRKRAQKLIQRILEELLGWKLDKGKSEGGASLVGLGVQITMDPSTQSEFMSFTLPDAKKTKWLTELQALIQSSHVDSARMSKMCGRLSWSATYILGRGTRNQLRALYNHNAQSKFHTKVSARTCNALQFFEQLLQADRATHAPLRHGPKTRRLVMYCDAEQDAGLGLAWDTGSTRHWSTSTGPAAIARKLLFRKNQTPAWEVFTAMTAVLFALQLAQNHGFNEVLICTDNSAALKAIRHGHSKQTDINSMAFNALLQAAQQHVLLVGVWVGSNANIADGPSRFLTHRDHTIQQKINDIEHMGFVRTPWPKVNIDI